MTENKNLLSTIVEVCEDRQASDCVILDMRELTPITDYYVICHGNNERQVQAIAKHVKDKMEEEDFDVRRMEGFEQGRWILLDMNDVVCHIFHKDERPHYNLERLWGDADEVSIEEL
ncbi:MAG TPA: ribosome silencing factor [Pseudogracilibacillus sp.]|nr:ribosome silencing factor [Pseudogracilibacillus sp.]